jgi:5-methyltetrahydrofolate--homocysteine methyltransferase
MALPAAIYSTWAWRSGDAPELWNTEHPDRIAALHRSFVDAGAEACC